MEIQRQDQKQKTVYNPGDAGAEKCRGHQQLQTVRFSLTMEGWELAAPHHNHCKPKQNWNSCFSSGLLAKQNTSEMREKESFMQKRRVGGLFLFSTHPLFLSIFK